MIKDADKEGKEFAEESGEVVDGVGEESKKAKRRQNQMTTHTKKSEKESETE